MAFQGRPLLQEPGQTAGAAPSATPPPLPILLRIPQFLEARAAPSRSSSSAAPRKKGSAIFTGLVFATIVLGYLRWHSTLGPEGVPSLAPGETAGPSTALAPQPPPAGRRPVSPGAAPAVPVKAPEKLKGTATARPARLDTTIVPLEAGEPP
ncbi:MAG: hypothetical protein JO112_13145 [Planctomycetes bacterium]|nr:hypothetical protein [Planctomycetota bacterium]